MKHQIEQSYKIKAQLNNVWEALVNPKIMDEWGAGPDIHMDLKKGGKFSLWGGDIYGTNMLVQAPYKLEQDWYGGDWKKPSKVVFELNYKDNTTTVILTHDDIPTVEVNDFAQGWKDYYLGPIKDLLEKSK